MEVMSYVSLEDCSLLQDVGYHMGMPPSPRKYHNLGNWGNVTISNDTKVEVGCQQAEASLLPAPELVLQHVQWLSVASLLYQVWCYSKSLKRYVAVALDCLIGIFIYLLILPVLLIFWIYSICANVLAQLQLGGISFTNRIPVRKLSAVDALWAQELPEARSIISAVLKLQGRPDLNTIQNHVAERLKNQEKMNLCITSSMGYFYWIRKEEFNLKDNIKLLNVGEVLSPEQYEQRVHNVVEFRCNAEISMDRPPWELLVVDHCRDEVDLGHYYLIFRIHHAVADGISIVQILLNSILDKPIEVPHMSLKKRDPNKVSVSPADILSLPVQLGREMKLKDNNDLHGKTLSGIKVIGQCDPIDLKDVKAVKNATGSTVNDVLISCITSATAKYFEEKTNEKPSVISSVIPIIIRNPQDMTGVANWFSIGVMRLPMEPMPSLQRLSCIQRLSVDLKRSISPIINGYLIQVMMSIFPRSVSRSILLGDEPNTLTISNVMGPSEKLSLWQHQIEKLWFTTPHRGKAGASVSIISYADKVQMTAMIDIALLPGNSQEKMDLITNGINEELQALLSSIPDSKKN